MDIKWNNHHLPPMNECRVKLKRKTTNSISFTSSYQTNEPLHDKTNKTACAPNKDSDQPRHPPSLIRVFAVRMKKAWVLSYPLSAQRSLCSDWVDAQADLSLRWAHSHFVGFVMRRLNLEIRAFSTETELSLLIQLTHKQVHSLLASPSYLVQACRRDPTCRWCWVIDLMIVRRATPIYRPFSHLLHFRRRLHYRDTRQLILQKIKTYEPEHDKTYKLHAPNKTTDQPAIRRSLIWVFPGHTYHFVGFRVAMSHMSRLMTKQNDCAPSEDSDQPGHPPSLISLRSALNS